jgi:long-chain acyl-CoA synthetase
MESSTAVPESTGSRTIADMMGIAAERYGDRTAVTFKRGDEWAEVSYRELGETVSEIARGLIALGLEPGDRAAVLCTTRPEWTYASFGITSAGGVVVPIYPTNSPEECEWVAGNSESRFVIAEDAEQVAKLAEVRDRLPGLEAIIVIDPSGDVGDAIPLDDLRERGRGRDAAEVAERAAAVSPEDRTPSSTRPAPPVRRRAAFSLTATTAPSSPCASRRRSCTRATSRTSTCRSPTPSRC